MFVSIIDPVSVLFCNCFFICNTRAIYFSAIKSNFVLLSDETSPNNVSPSTHHSHTQAPVSYPPHPDVDSRRPNYSPSQPPAFQGERPPQFNVLDRHREIARQRAFSSSQVNFPPLCISWHQRYPLVSKVLRLIIVLLTVSGESILDRRRATVVGRVASRLARFRLLDSWRPWVQQHASLRPQGRTGRRCRSRPENEGKFEGFCI